MASVIIAGDTSGTATLQAQAVAGSTTLTLPTTSGTLLTSASTITDQTLTNPTINGNITMGGSVITRATVNAGGTNPFPLSGGPAFVDFMSIPSWARRITVMFTEVSTTGSSNVQIQLGAGGTPTITGYVSTASLIAGTVSNTSSTTGLLTDHAASATANRIGLVTICNITGNTWVSTSNMQFPNLSSQSSVAGGYITLSGTLNMLRITTVTGVQTFDAGSINILYE